MPTPLRRYFILSLIAVSAACAQTGATMESIRSKTPIALAADPSAPEWKKIRPVIADRDRYGKPVPNATTEIRSRWDSNALSLLFVSRFESLKLKANPSTTEETWGLWDYDVVEAFIGHDLDRIHLYKEFEVSPQSEWVDLDVNREEKNINVDWKWNSGFRFQTRVDRERKLWYCQMQIPWKSISPREPAAGQQFRINLYRIEGEEPNRKYIAWQPVHAVSYHTPKAFGRLVLK